jgi:hypothetical protein
MTTILACDKYVITLPPELDEIRIRESYEYEMSVTELLTYLFEEGERND